MDTFKSTANRARIEKRNNYFIRDTGNKVNNKFAKISISITQSRYFIFIFIHITLNMTN